MKKKSEISSQKKVTKYRYVILKRPQMVQIIKKKKTTKK